MKPAKDTVIALHTSATEPSFAKDKETDVAEEQPTITERLGCRP